MRHQHLFGPVEMGDKALWLFCPFEIDLIVCSHCVEGVNTHAHTQHLLRGNSLSVLLGPILLPHFRSVPKQMQIVYDREYWVAAIPLA